MKRSGLYDAVLTFSVVSAPKRHKKGRPCSFAGTGASGYGECVQGLLVQSQSHVYGTSYSTSYHRVVADAEEAHHFYVGRNG